MAFLTINSVKTMIFINFPDGNIEKVGESFKLVLDYELENQISEESSF